MAVSLLRACSKALTNSNVQCRSALFSTSAGRFSDKKTAVEAPILDKDLILKDANDIEHKKQMEGYITITEPMDITAISGIPEEHIKTRRVRIYKPPKNAMQSGTNNNHYWQIEFDTRQRWENPLMGWASSGDPLSNMKIDFQSAEDAAAYCKKNGWQFYIQDATKKPERVKNYGNIFSWDKRTRASTK